MLLEKAARRDFRHDTDPLLRPGLSWDFDAALNLVLRELVAKLPGSPWSGEAPPS
jgi:hypothetical protein